MVEKAYLGLWVTLALFAIFLMPAALADHGFEPEWKYGGWVDEVVFRVIYDESERVLALSAGELDFIYSPYPIAPELLETLANNPDVKLVVTEDAGFQHVALHNDVFPTNITEFRRAIAYAMDKKFITEIIWKWMRPIDTAVPRIYRDWSNEDQIGGEFYEKNIPKAKEELAKGGFVDVDGDGWVEYDPDGDGIGADLNGDGVPNDDVEVDILTPSTPTARARTGPKIAQDLRDAGIKATATVTDFRTVILTALGTREEHKPWTIALWGWGLGRIPDHPFAFWATGATWNEFIYHISDPEADPILNKIVTSPDPEEVRQAILRSQEILLEKMFFVPYGEILLVQAHRTDVYEGWIVSPGAGVSSGDNVYNIRLITGGFGGTVRTTIITAPSTNNIVAVTDYYSLQYLGLLYPGLYALDPHKFAPPTFEEIVPTFASSIETEVVFDPALGKDIYKITITLIQNATWHDGRPITADDLVFSYELLDKVRPPLWGFVVETLINATKIDDFTVVVYGDTPSYTRWFDLTSVPLIPKHIWGDPATYGKATWDEVTNEDILGLDPAAEGLMIGAGPFKWKSYVEGELYVLEVYERYPYSVRNWPDVFAPVAPRVEAPGGIAPTPVVVAGETFEPDTYTGLSFEPEEITTTYEQLFAQLTTTLVALGIVGLVIGAGIGAVALRRR